MSGQRPLRRSELHPEAVVDGLSAGGWVGARLCRRGQGLLVSAGEREEAELRRLICSQPGPTRPNVVASISPKGGVGKTTVSFLAASVLATRMQTRTVVVDTNPDYGTLAALAPDRARCERTLADLLSDLDSVATATELNRYVSRLSTGVHLLGAPAGPAGAELTPDRYGELVAFLSVFYDVVVLDCGTGVGGPLARFALERADQALIVSTPEWVTASTVLAALDELQHERMALVLNMSRHPRGPRTRELEQRFRSERLRSPVIVPYDAQLRTMLDTATYTPGPLARATRLAIERVGLVVAERLV